MRASQSMLLTATLALIGCSKFTSAPDQKVLDAEAIGYACRVSQKVPEDCMKENETHSPTSILHGWKTADKEIEEHVIDPTMGKKAAAPVMAHSAPVAAESGAKVAAEKEVEKTTEKATGAKGEKPAEKTAGAKGEKPAAAKPDKGTAEKKANH